MSRSAKVLVTIAVAALALWLLFQATPFLDNRAAADRRLEEVEARLKNLRFPKCAEYTIPEGTHTRVFKYMVTEEFRCYFVIRLPDHALSGEYYLNRSRGIAYVTVPPGVEYYAVGDGGEPWAIFLNGEQELEPGEDDYYIGRSFQAVNLGYPRLVTQTADHWIYHFAFKPLTKGVEYNITIVIVTNLVRGTPPQRPIPTRGPTLAQRLGITDINQLMAYLGFQKCGEYNLEDSYNLTVTIPVDPNKGIACYLLLYPKDKSRWLKGNLEMYWHLNLEGEKPEWWNGSLQIDSIKGLLTGNPWSDSIINPYRAFSQKYRPGLHRFNFLGTSEPGDGSVVAFSLRKPEGFPTINGTLSVEIIIRARVL